MNGAGRCITWERLALYELVLSGISRAVWNLVRQRVVMVVTQELWVKFELLIFLLFFFYFLLLLFFVLFFCCFSICGK